MFFIQWKKKSQSSLPFSCDIVVRKVDIHNILTIKYIYIYMYIHHLLNGLQITSGSQVRTVLGLGVHRWVLPWRTSRKEHASFLMKIGIHVHILRFVSIDIVRSCSFSMLSSRDGNLYWLDHGNRLDLIGFRLGFYIIEPGRNGSWSALCRSKFRNLQRIYLEWGISSD